MKNSLIIIAVLILIGVGLFAVKSCTNKPQQHSQHNVGVEKNNTTVGLKGVPSKVYEVLAYVNEHHAAPDGYVGGRRFGNFEGILPKNDAAGNRINYKEWDVNPHLSHKNRGVERLVTGSDNKAYYTNDHYNTFTAIK